MPFESQSTNTGEASPMPETARVEDKELDEIEYETEQVPKVEGDSVNELSEVRKNNLDFQINFKEEFLLDFPGIKITDEFNPSLGIRGNIKIFETQSIEGEIKKFVIKYAVTPNTIESVEEEYKVLNYLHENGVTNIPKIEKVYEIPYGNGGKNGTVVVMEYIDRPDDETIEDLKSIAKIHDEARDLGIFHLDLNNGNVMGKYLIDWGGVGIRPDVMEDLGLGQGDKKPITYWTIPTFFSAINLGEKINSVSFSQKLNNINGKIWYTKIQILERFSNIYFGEGFGKLTNSLLLAQLIVGTDDGEVSMDYEFILNEVLSRKNYNENKITEIKNFVNESILKVPDNAMVSEFSMLEFVNKLENIFENGSNEHA